MELAYHLLFGDYDKRPLESGFCSKCMKKNRQQNIHMHSCISLALRGQYGLNCTATDSVYHVYQKLVINDTLYVGYPNFKELKTNHSF